MRITKDNIAKYLTHYGNLNLFYNKEITHIDYLPDDITYISISYSNVEEITCELPEGLISFHCYHTKLTSLSLLSKSLISFDGRNSNLPKEFQVRIYNDKIKCNQLRNLQLLELI